MNYIDNDTATKTLKPLRDAITKAENELQFARKRLSEEESRRQSLYQHGERLHATSGEAMTSSIAAARS